MNKELQPDDESATPEQRPLNEHLEGITAKSNGVAVKAAATSALADGWPRIDVLRAIEALGVGPGASLI